MQTELIPEGNYVIEDKKEYEKILKSYIKRMVKLTDEQLINFSKKVKTQPLSKETDWVASVVLNEFQNRNLENTDPYKTLTEYVRKSPIGHKRKLKSGKVITVKGPAAKPEEEVKEPKEEEVKEPPLIPEEAKLKKMGVRALQSIYDLIQKLSDDYEGKEELIQTISQHLEKAQERRKKRREIERRYRERKKEIEKLKKEKTTFIEILKLVDTLESSEDVKKIRARIKAELTGEEKDLALKAVTKRTAKIYRMKKKQKKSRIEKAKLKRLKDEKLGKVDKYGNTPTEVEELKRFIKHEVEGSVPIFEENWKLKGWKTGVDHNIGDKSALNSFKIFLSKFNLKFLQKTNFHHSHNGKFFFVTKIDDPKGVHLFKNKIAKDYYMRRMSEKDREKAVSPGGYFARDKGFFVVGGVALSFFSPKTTASYMVHEFGHDLLDALDYTVHDTFIKEYDKRMEAMKSQNKNWNDFFPSKYATKNHSELFCECLAAYFEEDLNFKESELYKTIDDVVKGKWFEFKS